MFFFPPGRLSPGGRPSRYRGKGRVAFAACRGVALSEDGPAMALFAQEGRWAKKRDNLHVHSLSAFIVK